MPLAVLLLSLAAAGQAPPPGPPPGGRRLRSFISPMGEPFRFAGSSDGLQAWFNQADRNHDGVLTVDEMQADAERFFATLDINHDGEIDPDEITRYEEVVAPRARVGLLGLDEPVAAADTDFNRGVSLDEFRQAAARRFKALDVDRQGRLTISALESLRPPQPPRPKENALPPEMGLDPGG